MADSVSVFGGRAPAEVEQLSKHLKTLDRDTISQMLSAVLKAVDGQDCSESLRLISESVLVSEDSFNHAVAGLYALLKEAVCLPSLRQEVFNEDLRALRVPEELIADVSSAVFRDRYSLSERLCYPVHQLISLRSSRQTSRNISDTHPGTTLAKIQDFKWRVDVAISTSSVSRALQPSVLMQIKLSDGHVHRFEVPVVKFQELRYNVSLILKEMNDLEKRSILKIQD